MCLYMYVYLCVWIDIENGDNKCLLRAFYGINILSFGSADIALEFLSKVYIYARVCGICAYICVYMAYVHILVCMHIHNRVNKRLCVLVIHAYIFIDVYMCFVYAVIIIHVYVYICAYAYISRYSLYVYVLICAYVCVCAYVYSICMCICIFYLYMYIYRMLWSLYILFG